jgi:DHA1 family bicyclomycin/chloramphenicol resistance-like MFS transporter
LSAIQSPKHLSLFEFVTLMAALTSLIALSIDAMLPALQQIGDELGANDPNQAHLIVSLFFIGSGVGQLFFGPFSDAYGRRPTVFFGLIIFVAGSLLCMWTTSMEGMLAGRIIQALGASGPRIAALAMVRDKYAGEAMARIVSFIMVVFILVPLIAPLVGQIILVYWEWRAIFWFFVLFALMGGGWCYLRQSETCPPDKRHPMQWAHFFNSCRLILTHPPVMGYTLASGFIFGAFLGYVSASQTLLQVIYDTGKAFPFYFALLALSVGIASFVNGKLVVKLGMKKLVYLSLYGLTACSCIQLILTSLSEGKPHFGMLLTILFISFFCVGMLFGNLKATAMKPLGDIAGLGTALVSSLSTFVSVPIAVIISGYISETVTPIALGFLVFSLLSLLSIKLAENAQYSE